MTSYRQLLAHHSLSELSEFFDQVDINLLNGIFQIISPSQKDILIDKTNERILRQVIKSDFKKGLLVVNHFNMP